MEENIKILEKCIRLFKSNDTKCLSGFDIRALENLIKEYRELEEENKQLKKYIYIAPNLDEITAVKYSHIQRDAYFRGRAEEQQKAEQIIYENYIPKSKIIKMIERLDRIINKDGVNYQVKAFARYSKEVLQELLEDK